MLYGIFRKQECELLRFQGGGKAPREPVIPRGIEVGRRLRIDCEGGCFSGLDYETQARASDSATALANLENP